jgi:hypothetical protein
LPDVANNFPDVFLPRPEDVQGKEVDVCGFYYGMPSTIPSFYVKCVENPDGTRMTNLLYYDEGILKADAPTNHIAVSAGESKRFVSVRATNGTWYWLAISMRINQEIHSSVSWSDVTSKPTTIAGYGITDAKIVGTTITLGNNTITPLTSFTESDPTVPSWAKQSSKPSYQFSEITNKPTTLAGYGITDAHITNGVVTLGANSITPPTSHQELRYPFAATIQPTAGTAAPTGTLTDRAGNNVVCTEATGQTGANAKLTLTLPPAVPGYVRDFLVKIDRTTSGCYTVDFVPYGNESVSYETADGSMPEVPDGAVTWLSFTESESGGVFAVRATPLVAVTGGS